GCIKPFHCQEEAIKLLDCLHPKWDPRHLIHQPNPELTAEEHAANIFALEDQNPITFDPNITLESDLSLVF
ncbi:hypothetical protein B0H10DRAFT_1829527, partial [Mycena sp. CBHHK59/15]